MGVDIGTNSQQRYASDDCHWIFSSHNNVDDEQNNRISANGVDIRQLILSIGRLRIVPKISSAWAAYRSLSCIFTFAESK